MVAAVLLLLLLPPLLLLLLRTPSWPLTPRRCPGLWSALLWWVVVPAVVALQRVVSCG